MQRLAWLGLVAVAAGACDRKSNQQAPAALVAPAVAQPTAPAAASPAAPAAAQPAAPAAAPAADPWTASGDPEDQAPVEQQPVPPQQPPPQSPPATGSDGPQFDLRPKRTFGALEGIRPSQDGDYMVGNGCNMLYKTTPYEAIFVFCNDQLVAGPLTTVEQIKDVYAQINQANTSAFELARSIRARMPTGCSNCRYTTYDKNGNKVRTE